MLARLLLVVFLIVFLLVADRGRTVYLCLSAVLAVIFIRKFRWKEILKASAAFLALLLIVAACFPLVRNRCMEAYHQAVEFQTEDYAISSDKESSIGNRLFMYKYGLQVVSLNPVFGTGTGSIAGEYDKQIAEYNRDRTAKWEWRIANPHCEILTMMIQYGVIGLILWIVWLGSLWFYSTRIGQPWSMLGRCLAAMITFSTLFSSHMSNTRTGCFYALMAALFFSAKARSGNEEPGQ